MLTKVYIYIPNKRIENNKPRYDGMITSVLSKKRLEFTLSLDERNKKILISEDEAGLRRTTGRVSVNLNDDVIVGH
jgi:hypothetical protein